MWTERKGRFVHLSVFPRQTTNRLPVRKPVLVPTGFGSTRRHGAVPFDSSPARDWIILETLVYLIAPSPEGPNKREKEINEK